MNGENVNKNNSSDSGISQEYDRKLFDSEKSKREYREQVFGEKATIVDENGVVLHNSHNAAKKKYHQKNKQNENISKKWTDHAAEVDHKVSLEELHKHSKKNPFLNDNDLKEIANSKENYQILSKRENASKGAGNTADIKTHYELQKKFAAKTAENAVIEFKKGAEQAVACSAMLIVTESLYKVIVEKENIGDVAIKAGEAIIETALIGGAEKLAIDAATQIFKNSGIKVLSNVVEMNAVGQILVLGTAIGGSVIKYINNEITSEELGKEIVRSCAIIGMSAIFSMAIPVPFIGPIISGVVVQAVSALAESRKHFEDYLIKERLIKHLTSEAIAEMEYQRSEFNKTVKENLDEWDKNVYEAFNSIITSSLEGSYDIKGIIDGLDKLLSLCGSSAKFHSVDEWESQLDTPLNFIL